jgi:hypothetical protein
MPAESHLTSLNLQGSFQWFDSATQNGSGNMLSGTLVADFTQLFESELFGYRVDGNVDISLTSSGLTPQLNGTADFKRYFKDDSFGIGVIGSRYTDTTGVEIDATGGLGFGRFRDVTPLAKAIQIQNVLLDKGFLLGPLTDDVLQSLAQELGRVGPSLDEKLVTLERLITGTGLVQEEGLGARGLFAMEEIASSSVEARLCGWDVQARVGVAASGFPSPQFSEAIVLSWNYALVPDPVSQWRASARWLSGLTRLGRYFLEGSLFYGRRIRENWRVRANYDFTRDWMWNAGVTTPVDRHQLSLSLLCQLSSKLSLTVDGEISHESGDEEPTETLSIHLSYDVF